MLPSGVMARVALGTTKDALGTTKDALGTSKDALGTTKDALGTTKHTLGTSKHALGTTKDALGTTKDALGTTKDALGTTKDALGTTKDALGTTKDALGTSKHALGTTKDALGTTKDALGTTKDALGTTKDALGTMEHALGTMVPSDGRLFIPPERGDGSVTTWRSSARRNKKIVRAKRIARPAVRLSLRTPQQRHASQEGRMSTPAKRTFVTARLKKRNYPLLLMRAWAIYRAWLANAQQLGATVASLQAFLALVEAFDAAQQEASASKDPLVMKRRNGKALAVILAVESWQRALQILCDASPAAAEQLIAAGGMFVRGTGRREKPLLGLSLAGGELGTVVARASGKLLTGGSRRRSTTNWQSSGNGGETILGTTSTPTFETTFAGVPLLSTLYVRVSVTLGKTTGEWSPWVSVFVH